MEIHSIFRVFVFCLFVWNVLLLLLVLFSVVQIVMRCVYCICVCCFFFVETALRSLKNKIIVIKCNRQKDLVVKIKQKKKYGSSSTQTHTFIEKQIKICEQTEVMCFQSVIIHKHKMYGSSIVYMTEKKTHVRNKHHAEKDNGIAWKKDDNNKKRTHTHTHTLASGNSNISKIISFN